MSSPHLLDEFGIVAALHVDPAGQRHPGARVGDLHRSGRGACRGSRSVAQWRGQDHRATLKEKPGPQREHPVAAATVLQFDTAALDADDGADESRLRILDHHPDFCAALNRTNPAGVVRVVGKDVGAIAVSHPVIVGSIGGIATEARGGSSAAEKTSECVGEFGFR